MHTRLQQRHINNTVILLLSMDGRDREGFLIILFCSFFSPSSLCRFQ